MQRQTPLLARGRWDNHYIDMLYVDESVLRLQDMKDIEELVAEALKRAGMTPTELGKRLGYVNGYQAYHDLFKSKRTKLTPQHLVQVAEILGLPKDHFQEPEKTEAREAYIRQQYEEFLQTDVARELDQDELRTIERMQFTGPKLPTKLLFQHIALAMTGRYTMRQVEEALALNEALDSEPPPKPRAPGKTRKGK